MFRSIILIIYGLTVSDPASDAAIMERHFSSAHIDSEPPAVMHCLRDFLIIRGYSLHHAGYYLAIRLLRVPPVLTGLSM